MYAVCYSLINIVFHSKYQNLFERVRSSEMYKRTLVMKIMQGFTLFSLLIKK